MVAAVFLMNTMFGRQERFFEGENASKLLAQLWRFQDLGCLSRQVAMMGTKKDQKEAKKLDAVLEKYFDGTLELEDLNGFDMKLSIGGLSVIQTSDKEEEIAGLRKKYASEE